MKYVIAFLLTASLFLSGCVPCRTQDDTTTIPSPPTGTNSTAPAPQIGPEGLPTPTL